MFKKIHLKASIKSDTDFYEILTFLMMNKLKNFDII